MSIDVTTTGNVDANLDTTTSNTTNLNGADPTSDDRIQLFNNGNAIVGTVDPGVDVDGNGLELLQQSAAVFAVSMANDGTVSSTLSGLAAMQLTGNGGDVTYTGTSTSLVTGTLGASGLALNNVAAGSGTVTATVNGDVSGGVGIVATQFAAAGTGSVLVEVGTTTPTDITGTGTAGYSGPGPSVDAGNGIYAKNYGDAGAGGGGTTTVTLGTSSTVSATAGTNLDVSGILAESLSGLVSVTTGTSSGITVTGNGTGSNSGIYAASGETGAAGFDSVIVQTGDNSTITVNGGDDNSGIFARNDSDLGVSDGNISIFTGAGSTINVGNLTPSSPGEGIGAYADGAATTTSISIVANGGGSAINVTGNGVAGINAHQQSLTGDGDVSVQTDAVGGAHTINVTDSAVGTASFGINATNNGTGTVTVDSASTINALGAGAADVVGINAAADTGVITVKVNGAIAAATGTGVSLNGNAATNTIDATAAISGATGIRTAGGTTTLTNSTGSTTITGTTAALDIDSGTLVVGAGTISLVGNVSDDGVLRINRATAFSVAGDISGTGSLEQTGAGTTILTGTNTYALGTTISAGTLQLGNGGATGSITGNILDNATLAINRTGTLTLAGNITGTGALQQNGTGTTVLSGTNTYGGATTVNAGTLQVDGSITSAVTINGGTLKGSGSVGALTANSGAHVAPGNSPETLNTGDFTLNSGATLDIEIAGTTAGTQYDQVVVTGTVTLDGFLETFLLSGFNPATGNAFTIIDNDLADAVSGIFTGLAEGATFTDTGGGTSSYQITYVGGTNNNDVVLTAINDGPATDLNGGTGGDDNTASFTEQTPVLIAPAGTITDVDDTNIDSLTATLSPRPDGDGVESLSLDATAAAAAAGLTVLYTPGTGVLSITGSAPIATYQTILQGIQYNNTSDTPTTTNRNVDVTVNDGDASSPVNNVTISVTAANDPPATDLNGGVGGDDAAASFTEQTPVVIAPAATITDVDDTNMESLTATLTNRPDGDGVESLSLNAAAANAASLAGLTVLYTPATGVLSITGPAATATYETILQGIRYSNTSENPNTTNRIVNVVVNDGTDPSVLNTVTIGITAVNDAPSTDLNGGTGGDDNTASFTEQTPVVIAPAGTITDVDDTNIESLTATLTTRFNGNAAESLSLNGAATAAAVGLTVGYTAATGVLSITGSATKANYQTILQGIQYNNTSDAPNLNPRNVDIVVNDGDAPSAVNFVTISLSAVNDGPTNTVPGAQIVNEDTATAITGISVADPDAAPQQIQVTLHVDNGILDVRTDVGGGVDAAHVTGDTTGTVTLLGTPAQINATLGAASGLTYQSNLNYVGADQLDIITNDLGHTGTPGPLSDTDLNAVNITVNELDANTLTAVQTNAFAPGGDTDADGVVDPGENIVTTVVITNNSETTTATGVTFAENVTGMLVTDTNVQPLAGNDSYTAIGNTTLRVGGSAGPEPERFVTGSVLDNDVNLDLAGGDSFTIDSHTLTSSGTLTFDNNTGTFVYNPNAGFTGTDTFTYTVRDEGLDNIAGNADDLFDTATVSITVTNMVWYVDSAAAINGDGTSDNPFNIITAANLNGAGGAGDLDAAGHYIYLEGGANTAAFGLEANQHLIGTGSALVVDGFTLAAATGTRSTLTNNAGTTLTLASGNEVAGLNVNNTGGAGTALSGTNFGTATIANVALDATGGALNLATGTVAGTGFVSVDSDGGTNNVSLTGVSGTVALGFGALAGATGAGFVVSGGNANVTFSGTMAHASAGRLISVSDTISGSVTFNNAGANALTDSGSGILIDGAAGNVTINNASLTGTKGIEILGDTANNATGTFTFNNVAIDTGAGAGNHAFIVNGDVSGVAGNDVTGTIDLNNVDITNPGGNVANIAGLGGGSIDFDSASAITNTTGLGIVATSNAGGTITFGGSAKAISTGTNAAVNLTSNTGAIINFTNGGLDIDTTTGAGFTATGGGTVSVAGSGNSINSSSGPALDLNGVIVGVGNIQFASTDSGGGARGVNIDTVTSGSISLGTGTLSGHSAAAIDINGGNTVVTYGGVIGNGTGLSAEITGHSGGNITLSGNINDNGDGGGGIVVTGNTSGTIEFSGTTKTLNTGTGAGVTLTNNTGATVNFSGGGLDIDTTTGAGFTATGAGPGAATGGTVNVTGSNNSIASGTGTALNIVNTTIGVSDLNFVSISSSGAVNGIVLNNTGTDGGLTVTGDATTSANGSGGVIQNSTGVGISLTNTRDVSLDQVNVTGGGDDGIHGVGVVNFTLNRSNITGNGNSTTDDGLQFGEATGSVVGVTGNVSILASSISGNAHNNVHIRNTSGTISNLTVTGSTFNNLNDTFGANSFLFEASGTSTITEAFITGSTFSNNSPQRALEVQAHDTATISDFVVRDNKFADNGIHASFTQDGSSNLEFYFVNNGGLTAGSAMTGTVLQFINVFSSSESTGGTIVGTISGNKTDSGATNAPGISAVIQGQTDATLLIDGNTINNVSGARGISVAFRGPTGESTNVVNDVTITNNNVDNDNGGAGTFPASAISVEADNQSGSFAGAPTVRADIRGNTVPSGSAFDATTGYLQFYEYDGDGTPGEFQDGIGQLVDTAPASANATAQLASTNTGSVAAVGIDLIAGPINTPPSVPTPLLAATGGIDAAPPESSTPPAEDAAPPADDTPPADTAPAADSTPPQETASGSGAGDPPATPPAAAHPIIVDDGVLSQSELDWFVDAAIARWETAGLTAEQSAALHDMTFSVADMAGWYLGSYSPDAVQLDSDGAGYGWFLDTTPLDDSEFGNVADATRLLTDPTGAPAGHVDLLTTVMHEMGHQLGLDDTYSLGDRSDLMYGYLVTGERRLPGAGDADGAVAGSITSEEFQIATINLGNLAPDDEITIQWAATITPSSPPSNNFNELISHPTNVGQVTATNAVGFPDANTNQSVVTLDSLSLGDRIYVDLNGNQTYDAGEGRDGVTLTLRADTNGSGGFDAGDAVLGTTTTGGGGAYVFTGLAPGDYIVQVDAANFNPGGALHDGVAPAFSLTGAPDPDNNIDNDDNGAAFAGAGVVSGALTLAYNTEPDGSPDIDGDLDADTNFTLDLGFAFVAANAAPTVTAAAADHTFSESTGAPVQLEPALDVIDDDDEITSATVVITNFLPGDQLLFTIPGGSPITGAYNPLTGILTLSSAPTTAADYEAVLQSVQFDHVGDNPTGNGLPGANAQRIITWTVNDGNQDSAAADSVVNIVAENDAPVLIAGATPVLNAVNEDAGAPGIGSGTLISDLVNLNPPAGGLDNVTEPDGTTLTGIALTAVDTANGTWSYTTDGGTSWFSVGAVTDDSARVLAADANTRLYFQPTTLNFNGGVIDAITFRAWDRSSGTNGTLADTTPAGGTTAFSTASDTANITVTAVNDAPVLIPAATPVLNAVNEDAAAPGVGSGTLISDLVDLNPPGGGLDNVTDVDASPVTGIALTNANTANGAWFYTIDGGTNWLAVGAVTDDSARLLAADANTRLYFQPNLNFNGTVANAITFRAWDQTSGTNGTLADPTPAGTTTAFSTDPDSANITVNAINDDPAAAGVPTDVTVTEDVLSNVDLSAITLTDVDSDPDDITVTLAASAGTLTSASGGSVIVAGSGTGTLTLTGTVGNIDAFLNTASNIRYTTVLNANGDNVATLTLTANDGGNNGAGGGGNVALGTVNIDSTAVNDDPAATGVPSDRTVTEDVASNLDLSAITLTDVDSDPDDITLTLTASAGTLASATGGGVTVGGSGTGTLTLTGTVGNIDAFLNTASNIQYTTALNANGDNVATVALTANDGGNNGAGGGGNVALGTVNIDSTAINDAPVFANLGGLPQPAFTEGGSSAVLDNDATVSDVEIDVAGNYGGTTLILQRNGLANPDDVFAGTAPLDLAHSNGPGENVSLDNGATFIGTFTQPGDGTFSITFNSNATGADVATVMQHIIYANVSDNPPTSVQISFLLSDGNGVGGQPQGGGPTPGIGSGIVTVNITQVDDPPVLLNVAPTAAYAILSPGTTLSPALGVFDPDATPPSPLTGLASATIQISNGFFAGDELFVNLTTDGGGHFITPDAQVTNIVVQSNVAGTLILSGNDTVAHYQSVLDAVSYHSTAADPSNGGANPTRNISWQVNDGLLNSQTPNPDPNNLVNVTVLHFATPPVLDLDASGAGTGFTTSHMENTAAIPIVDTDVSIADGDSAALSFADIVLTNAKPNDQLTVAGVLPGGIDSSIDTSVPGQITLHLFNSATLADYQTALRQIRFSTNDLSLVDRDIAITVSNDLSSNTAHATVHVTPFQLSGSPGNDSFVAFPAGNEIFDAGAGVDTVTFGFRLVDATVTYSGHQVIIDGPGSHSVLSGFEVFNFTDGTVHNDDGSPLIDDLFYYSQYHDVWNAHADADAHYNTLGWHELRNPNAFFDTNLYLSANPDVRASGVNPLSQYDSIGWTQHRITALTFNGDSYLAANPDVAAAHIDPLLHFLAGGAGETRQPIAPTEWLMPNGFDFVYYLQHNPDVAAAHIDPFVHFQTGGWMEGRNPNALFDTNAYLAAYPDIAAAHVNPLDHFHNSGWLEGRDPSVNFDTTSYLAAYPDVAAAHVDPLVHFLGYGIHEGRSPFADGAFSY